VAEGALDYTTAEGQEAIRLAHELMLDLREDLSADAYERKVALYERTLGLAVIPVLVRRALRRLGLWPGHRSGTRP
jgi:hypothetical protein